MFRENQITALLLFVGLSASVDSAERPTTNRLTHNTQKVFSTNASIVRIIQTYLKTSENDSHKQTKNCVFCHSGAARI
ncbi:hypothetical protein EHQ76_08675 [Leptospira barantonii]|uniref:Uncharacterized protein n=1 Tax=Leptospira barantonii TaxID=2023184 RepID=A0A5F2BHU9_9LEPT|nr:hypothetical protein [Leptospira barantonii]TGM03710.1 hypothetical protein EHQ76_08675 [Leptospira barantonii]